jgi:hypothetical protein
MTTATVVSDGITTAVDARIDGAEVFVTGPVLTAATGWTLKPEGLCRDEVCVPVRDRAALVAGDEVGLGAFAAALGRSAVVDADRGVVAIGEAVGDVRRRLEALDAPDFDLPTLDGTRFRFSAIGRKKKLLVAWASW